MRVTVEHSYLLAASDMMAILFGPFKNASRSCMFTMSMLTAALYRGTYFALPICTMKEENNQHIRNSFF